MHSPPYILNPVKISVRTGEGIAELTDRIYDELMGKEFSSDSVLITNGRHKEALAFADSEIGKALTELESGARSTFARYIWRAPCRTLAKSRE